MVTHKRIRLCQRSSSSGGSGGLGAEAGQSGLIGTAVVARALEAERACEHTHDLVRRPPPVSLRYAWHEGSTVAIRLGLRGGIPRYVFSPYFRRIFLMSEYGPKYAYFRVGGYVFNSTARGKPRFCPNFAVLPVYLGFPREINSPPPRINQVSHAGRPA